MNSIIIIASLILTMVFVSGLNIAYGEPKGVLNSTVLASTNLNVESESYGNSSYIVGTAKNIIDETLGNIRLIVEVYDSANQLIDVIERSPSFGELSPNATSPFKIPIDTVNFDHYVIRVGADRE